MAHDLTPGQPAPDFELRDADGNVYRLSDLRRRKVILYFYPADDTPGCTAEACDFRDTKDVWDQADYVVLGVSRQGPESKKAFRDKYGLNFPLLIDADGAVLRAYGIDAGSPGGRKNVRSTFVIDETGTIIEALYGVRARGHVDDLRQRLAV